MKKLLTVDDVMVAVVSAMGYGYGDAIARLSGWSPVMCLLACLALGITIEIIVRKIVFSKSVQKSRAKRVLVFAAIILFFLTAQYVAIQWMGVSMVEYLEEELLYVIGLPIIGFVVNLLIGIYRVRKIRKLYGDGSNGYVFNLKKEDIDETNRQNQRILGEYDADLSVKTRTGIFVGEKYKKTVYYLGIPYAKPPVGDLRWKAPEALPASEEVFEAKNFGSSAVQVEHKGTILKNHRQSEDCLYLNICVSNEKPGKKKAESKKPVIVLFHHGDFSYGGSADPLLYGTNYVNKHPDIVFVSFNYRLGIFGFIDFSEIEGGEAYPDALNLGLLDQIAALRWIRENIASFGGDPERITALGFEAGASSICLLAASKSAKGLFKRAFVFNGSPESAYITPDNSGVLARDLLKETHTSTMKELSELKTETLKEAAQRLWMNMCAPTCDGVLIPKDIYGAYTSGAASGIDFTVGITSNEVQVLRASVGAQNYEQAVLAAVASLPNYVDSSVLDAVQKYIDENSVSSSELEVKSKLVEKWLELGVYRTAVKLVQGGNKMHLMYWDEKPLIEKLGSGSIDVAAALLGNSEALRLYGSMERKGLSVILQEMLRKFICGDDLELYSNEINGVNAISWDSFPKALIVSDGKISCGTMEDRLSEVKVLYDYMTR